MNETLIPVTMARRTGALTLTGEATAARGLFIVPATTEHPDGRLLYEGGWQLAHQSGYTMIRFSLRDLPAARDLADRLAGLREDWTDLPTETSEWPGTLRADTARVISAHLEEMQLDDLEESGVFSGATMSGGGA